MPLFRSNPFGTALLAGLLTAGALVAADWASGPRLVVPAISAAEVPVLDGDISDAAWAMARPVRVLTRHGGDFGGSGETAITVRAVHDSQNVYLALEWDDPTRSLEYMPLFKNAEGWHSLQADAAAASDERFFDDRIAIMLAPPGLQLIGGAIHLGKAPLAGAPPSMTGRGLHYTAPGKLVDLWLWHAAVGALSERVQDDYIGPPQPFTPGQVAGAERYLGGIGEDDPTHPVSSANFAPALGKDGDDLVPLRLPRGPTTTMAEIAEGASQSVPSRQDSLWAVRETTSTPYSASADQEFAVGDVIPGVMVADAAKPGPQDAVAQGAWAGGHWVLELRRSLAAGDKDIAFQDGTMLWFAAFDHSQTRHSYHLRPLIVEME